jgi:hypothetical protein
MHSTAISLTLPALTNTQRQQLLEDTSVCSLYELFATIPDPRRKEGQRYELPYLLTCLVVALLCNCNSTLAVGQWCREHRSLLECLFGSRRFLCPSDSLYRYPAFPHQRGASGVGLSRLDPGHPGGCSR